MIKALASLILLLCLCLPGWAGENVSSVDKDAIKHEILKAVTDLQIEMPELLKAVRIKIQIPDIELHIPEMNVQLPEIQLPEIHLEVPVMVHIPPILIPEIRIQIPRIDIQMREFSHRGH